MTLSVVIPALDAEPTIAVTLRGLLAHPEVTEVIVVDDGSRDSTAAIARSMGATVLAGPGTGPSAARNAGVAAATGELLAFCDADDDWIAPTPDPRLIVLGTRSDVDAAWGETICTNEGGVETAPTHLGALHGLVMRREAFDRVGPLDPSLRLGEDVDWILRARACLRIEMVEGACYRYHLRAGSLSAGDGRRASGLLAAVRLAARRAAAQDEVTAATVPVDVVVPSADAERYLVEALRSVLDQVPRPTSVVVADDASTDASVRLARGTGAHVVTLGKREGPNVARMAGVSAGDADLLAFCDADDLWPPGRLAVMMDALAARPDVAGVVGRVEAFASPERDVSGLEVPVGPQPGVVIGALLIRRSDLEAVGGLRTDLISGELVALERALTERGRVLARVDDVVLRRRIHGDNLTIRRSDEVQRAYLRLAIEQVRKAP